MDEVQRAATDLTTRPDSNLKQNMKKQCIAASRYRNPRAVFVSLIVMVTIGALDGCGDEVSDADVAFVAAMTPAQFESLRMYNAPPDNVTSGAGYLSPPARLQQGCEAIIRSSSGPVREAVILESVSAASFDLDAVRKTDGWAVTSDDFAPPSANPVEFRSRFTSCVSAIQDKYLADPDKVG